MIGVVLLSLLMMTAVVGCVGLLMFWDVAFCGPGSAACVGGASRAGRPGRTAARIDGVELALRVEVAVSRLVSPLGTRPAAAPTCAATCHDREIRVTTPEALAIVQDLREHLPADRVDAIRVQAQRNLAWHDGGRHCPLLLSGGFCACVAARPVSCRTRCVAGADSDVQARLLAESVGDGAKEIFRDCLQASGLDDVEYELNQALVRVLDTPYAARRWAQGERILETAMPHHA